jgi:transcriptional regulator
MYLPAHFAVLESAPLLQLIAENPLGLLITHAQGQVFADSIPFLLVHSGTEATLECHVARANPIWQRLQQDANALVVFQGVSSYISPAYYASKKEHGKVVPTWNYLVAQARGKAQIHDDPGWVHAHVSRNTQNNEAKIGSDWQVTDAPPDYIDTLLKAIVGVSIPISALVGKFKLSQNVKPADRQGVVSALQQQSNQASKTMAQAVSDQIELSRK